MLHNSWQNMCILFGLQLYWGLNKVRSLLLIGPYYVNNLLSWDTSTCSMCNIFENISAKINCFIKCIILELSWKCAKFRVYVHLALHGYCCVLSPKEASITQFHIYCWTYYMHFCPPPYPEPRQVMIPKWKTVRLWLRGVPPAGVLMYNGQPWSNIHVFCSAIKLTPLQFQLVSPFVLLVYIPTISVFFE